MKYLILLVSLFTAGVIASAQQLQPTKAIQVQKVLVMAAVSIPISTTTSVAIPLSGLTLVGVQLPAAFTGTTLTFQGSLDGTTFQPVYSTITGTALSYTVAQGHYVAVDPTPFYGLQALKLVSGSTEIAARSFSVALKGF